MWRICCAFLLVFLMTETQASPGDYCIDVSDCDSGECCQILSPMQVMSRKRGSGGNSTCQRYQRLGQGCDPFDHLNGYCGCEPGTKCTYHPPPPTRPPPTPPPTTRGIPELPPPSPTYPSYIYTIPDLPAPTTLIYPDNEDPPSGRKKRAFQYGATFDCQPI